MTAIEAALLGAVVAGVVSIVGVLISTRAQSKDTAFSNLVKAYEAMAAENERLRLEDVRKGQRISDLEGQLARAYGQRRRGESGS